MPSNEKKKINNKYYNINLKQNFFFYSEQFLIIENIIKSSMLK